MTIDPEDHHAGASPLLDALDALREVTGDGALTPVQEVLLQLVHETTAKSETTR